MWPIKIFFAPFFWTQQNAKNAHFGTQWLTWLQKHEENIFQNISEKKNI